MSQILQLQQRQRRHPLGLFLKRAPETGASASVCVNEQDVGEWHWEGVTMDE
jgi:hypothetical protein